MSDNLSPNIMMDPVTGNRYEAVVQRDSIQMWMQTPAGQSVVGDYYSHYLQLGDKIRIESSINSNVITILLNGEAIISVDEPSLQEGHPGLHAWNNETASSSVAIDNFKAGGSESMEILPINGDNSWKSNQINLITGNFQNTTITSVTLSQDGAIPVAVPFTQTGDVLSCTPLDMHSTQLIDWYGNVLVSDGQVTTARGVFFTAEPEFTAYSVNSVDPKGILRDIPTAVSGDIIHVTPEFNGSTVTVDTNGMLATFDPAVPTNSYALWWHWSKASRLWTRMNITITDDFSGSTSRDPWTGATSGQVKGVEFFF